MTNVIGEKFGRYTILKSVGKDSGGHPAYLCRCECGMEKKVALRPLKLGKVVSCGCWHKEMVAQRALKHGHGGDGKKRSKEYLTWAAMMGRCYSKKCTGFKNYGARGITVCDRWLANFPAFLADMGPKPTPQHSLDRIDNNGNYEPGNCRWATKIQQGRNRQGTIHVKFNGRIVPLPEAVEISGSDYMAVYRRIKRGVSFGEIHPL